MFGYGASVQRHGIDPFDPGLASTSDGMLTAGPLVYPSTVDLGTAWNVASFGNHEIFS